VRVDWAIPCRYAEVHPQGGATIIGAGTDALVVPTLPSPGQILFAVRLVGAPEELDGTTSHAVLCRLFRPNGESMGEQRAELGASVTQLVSGYLADVTLPIGVVLEITEYGTYDIEFQIDDSPPLRVPIHVIEPSTPAG
jgi:hypothetical protein